MKRFGLSAYVVLVGGGCFGEPDPVGTGSEGTGMVTESSTPTSGSSTSTSSSGSTTDAPTSVGVTTESPPQTTGMTTDATSTGTTDGSSTTHGSGEGSTGSSTGGEPLGECEALGFTFPIPPSSSIDWSVCFFDVQARENVEFLVSTGVYGDQANAAGCPATDAGMMQFWWGTPVQAAVTNPGPLPISFSSDGFEPLLCTVVVP